eukprot:gene9277-10989_t
MGDARTAVTARETAQAPGPAQALGPERRPRPRWGRWLPRPVEAPVTLDPDALLLSLIAERGSAGGTLTAASAVTGGDGESDPGLRDLVVEMCRKMKLLEQFLKQLRGGVAAVKAAKGQRGSMAGFPTGSQAVPQAKDGAAAHYFMPGDIESMRTLAVCQRSRPCMGSSLNAPVAKAGISLTAASLVDDEKECENGITAAAASAVPASFDGECPMDVGTLLGGHPISASQLLIVPDSGGVINTVNDIVPAVCQPTAGYGFGRPRDVLWLNLHVYSLPENAVKVWLGLLQANGAGSAPAAGNAWPGGVDIPTDGIP